MKTGVPQKAILPKIIAYLELQGSLPDKRRDQINLGLCHSFSVVHAYMAAENALPWWYAVLNAIDQWDIKTDPRDQIITISGYPNPYNLNELLRRTTHYLLFNFAANPASDIWGINQPTFLIPGGLFCSEKGSIRHYAVAAGNFSSDTLQQLLIKHVFKHQAIFLISSMTHACSLRVARQKWYFYNPNSAREYMRSSQRISDYLIKKLGSSLVIQVAAWQGLVSHAVIRLFELAYHALLNNDLVNLIRGPGLRLIAWYDPNQMSKIFMRAKTCDDLRAVLAQALIVRDKNGVMAIQDILISAPGELTELTELYVLAQNDRDIRSAIAQALVNQDKNGFTLLSMIAVDVPDQLDNLFALAHNHRDIRSVLVQALALKTNHETTIAYMIAYEAPNQFGKLLALGQNHGHVREAIAHICMECCRKLTETALDPKSVTANNKVIRILKETIGLTVWDMLCAGNSTVLKKFWIAQVKESSEMTMPSINSSSAGVTFFSEGQSKRRYVREIENSYNLQNYQDKKSLVGA